MMKAQRPLDERFKGTRFMPSTVGGVDTPICFLTTTGRVTGEPRTVPLVYVPAPDGTVAVVASNYGQRHHPAWSHNLDANPEATLEVDGSTSPVIARRAETHEAKNLWAAFDHVWPGYEAYRDLTDRDIRMYVLTPVPQEA